jgi:hypothetical protein
MAAPSTAATAEAAVTEAVAAARVASPAVVEQLDVGSIKPKGASRSKSGVRWHWTTQALTAAGMLSQTFRTAAEAACAADLLQLALRARRVASQQLNFPPDMYQQQQVAAWAELLQQLQPNLQLPVWDAEAAAALAARAAAERAAVSAAADAAEAAQLSSPAAAQQLERGDTEARFVQHRPSSKLGQWRWKLQHHGKMLTWYFSSRLEACCAADLARLALHGPLVRGFNLPAATYTQQQVAAWQQLLKEWRVSNAANGEQTTAAGAYEVESAANAAIAAAAEAAAAEAALFSGQQPAPHGSWVGSSLSLWCMSLQGSIAQGKKFVKYTKNGVQAAAAADLIASYTRKERRNSSGAELSCKHLHAAAGGSHGSTAAAEAAWPEAGCKRAGKQHSAKRTVGH